MQVKILKNKDPFTFLCGFLIAFAFLSHLVFHSKPLAQTIVQAFTTTKN